MYDQVRLPAALPVVMHMATYVHAWAAVHVLSIMYREDIWMLSVTLGQ
jgi:hypothetical protein